MLQVNMIGRQIKRRRDIRGVRLFVLHYQGPTHLHYIIEGPMNNTGSSDQCSKMHHVQTPILDFKFDTLLFLGQLR